MPVFENVSVKIFSYRILPVKWGKYINWLGGPKKKKRNKKNGSFTYSRTYQAHFHFSFSIKMHSVFDNHIVYDAKWADLFVNYE